MTRGNMGRMMLLLLFLAPCMAWLPCVHVRGLACLCSSAGSRRRGLECAVRF